ncbi:MAG: hypothetical protein K2J83_05715 [Clostridia bacterium]|nr:hypothetical protein [Clostridia bacterium]
MKFKHTFNVFIDNFSVTFKQLLYRLIIVVIAAVLYALIITPFKNALTGSEDYVNLVSGIKGFLSHLVQGRPTDLAHSTEQIKTAFDNLLVLVSDNRANIVWGVVGVVAVHFVEKFFTGLGNYAAAAVINDKMALRANSSFCLALIRNLKEASLYNLMYVPLSLIYDAAILLGLYYLVFKGLFFVIVPLQLCLFVTLTVFAISLKMMFTTDWLPALIRGKKGAGKAFLYTFNRRGKNSANVLANFFVIIMLIFILNVAGAVFTLGAGLLITVPSSYVILVCFEFVNYYDREELKYFIDKKTIIKPEKERPLSREEFFRGE